MGMLEMDHPRPTDRCRNDAPQDGIKLTLPISPLTNNMYLTMIVPRSRTHKAMRFPSDEAKRFKKTVAAICVQEELIPYLGNVEVTINIYRPRRVGDTDGYLKSAIDALSGFAYLDDKQVSVIHAYRHDDKAHPRVEIEVRPLGLL